jgi:predicted small lipoprotein YifL
MRLHLSLIAIAAALAGCGKTGTLERPAPMFGAQAKADYQAQKEADGAAKAREAAARRSEQGNTVFDPIDQPATQAPYAPDIPGRTNPLGPGPQTVGGGDTAPDR